MNLRLAKKNRDVVPSSWEKLYGSIVAKEFRKKYSSNECEAIVNNYLDDPKNEKYVAELKEMQEYRKKCKILAKSIMGM